jgi:DNA-binding response OmpR family regulator
MRILLVEDDPLTGLALLDSLGERQYGVKLATDGETGLQLAQSADYDLMLLDVVLPKLDGISVCRQLRAQGFDKPIILLTAKDSSSDRVLGLDAGADDYIVKPFDLPELLARIRALLRRGKVENTPVITWENVRFNPEQSEVSCDGKLLHLTPKEYCVLELFLLNPKRVFSRGAILDRLWDFAASPGEETVSSHIYSLRQKLKAVGANDLIETVHGLGYRLKSPSTALEPDDSSATVISANIAEDLPTTPSPAAAHRQTANLKRQANRQKLAKTWTKFLPQLSAQIMQLEKMVNALVAGHLSAQQQQQAEQTAHKLAGSLGVFGWQEGSRLAKALEDLLQQSGQLSPEQVNRVVTSVRSLRQDLQQWPTASRIADSDGHAGHSPVILIVDDDQLLAEQVQQEAIHWGMCVEVANDLAAARTMIAERPPNAVLLDLNFPASTENGLTLLGELATQFPRLPVLVYTVRESLSDRIEVVQLGGRAFLHKPLPMHQILSMVSEVLPPARPPSPSRVLVVDNDADEVVKLAGLLKPWSIEVTALARPQQFWEVLTAFEPDLLILNWDVDWALASLSSVDLCRVVRQDPHWKTLPIVVVTAQSDPALMRQAFAAGASDFLQRPMVDSELITQIISRLEGTVDFESAPQ